MQDRSRRKRERERERALLPSDQLRRTLLRPPANSLIAILNIRQPKHKRKALLNTELAVLETIISAVAIIPGPPCYVAFTGYKTLLHSSVVSPSLFVKGRKDDEERERERCVYVLQYPKRKLNKFASVVGKSC